MIVVKVSENRKKSKSTQRRTMKAIMGNRKLNLVKKINRNDHSSIQSDFSGAGSNCGLLPYFAFAFQLHPFLPIKKRVKGDQHKSERQPQETINIKWQSINGEK